MLFMRIANNVIKSVLIVSILGFSSFLAATGNKDNPVKTGQNKINQQGAEFLMEEIKRNYLIDQAAKSETLDPLLDKYFKKRGIKLKRHNKEPGETGEPPVKQSKEKDEKTGFTDEVRDKYLFKHVLEELRPTWDKEMKREALKGAVKEINKKFGRSDKRMAIIIHHLMSKGVILDDLILLKKKVFDNNDESLWFRMTIYSEMKDTFDDITREGILKEERYWWEPDSKVYLELLRKHCYYQHPLSRYLDMLTDLKKAKIHEKYLLDFNAKVFTKDDDGNMDRLYCSLILFVKGHVKMDRMGDLFDQIQENIVNQRSCLLLDWDRLLGINLGGTLNRLTMLRMNLGKPWKDDIFEDNLIKEIFPELLD